MILQAKYSAAANLVVVLWICFMVTHCPCAPPAYVEPIIYVTLARWENRTFSPRIYYVMMSRQQQQSNLNQVQEGPYPYESPIPVHKLDEKQAHPFFSVRNSFHKKTYSDGLPSTESGERLPLIGDNENITNTDLNATEDIGVHMLTELMEEAEQVRITFEEPDKKDKGSIVFEDAFSTSTTNRRMKPDGNHQKSQAYKALDQCEQYRHVTKGKDPRNIRLEDHIGSLHFTLLVIKNNDPMEENAVFSPLSLLNILALLFLGSEDATFNELSQLLRVGGSKDEAEKDADGFHCDFSEILLSLNNGTNPKVLLETANQIFADTKYPILEAFKNNANRLYRAKATGIDFTTGGEKFRADVNEWVRDKTKGKISSIIDAPPSPLTTLALVNAIYFQGTWEVPFASHITRDGVFHVDERSTVSVKLMTNIVDIPYLDTESYKMIRLAYKEGNTAMYIILPKVLGSIGLRDTERHLNLETLTSQIRDMTTKDPSLVTVKLPKMRVQSDGHVKDLLWNLGVKSIFSPDAANFSKISLESGLHVSSILHRAVVDINEKGTEAAAVSVATGDRIIGNNPVTFNVNRPFIFFIYDNTAETVLFWGRIFKPEPLDE